MDCQSTQNRLVAYLEGQLAPADAAWVEQHLEACTTCVATAETLATQGEALAEIGPAHHPPLPSSGFWDQMDAELATAREQLEPPPAEHPRRAWQISSVGMIAYAAAMVLALMWGWGNQLRADAAHDQVNQLNLQLEREQRLAAQPAHATPADAYRTVSYTPHRGTF